jgi:hypothetical protein
MKQAQQIFHCSSDFGMVNGRRWVYLEADRWWDARGVAYRLFGTDRVDFKVVERPNVPIPHGNAFTLEWVGSPLNPNNPPELKVTPWTSAETPSSSSESSSSPAPQAAPTASPEGTPVAPVKTSKLNGASTKVRPSKPPPENKSKSKAE